MWIVNSSFLIGKSSKVCATQISKISDITQISYLWTRVEWDGNGWAECLNHYSYVLLSWVNFLIMGRHLVNIWYETGDLWDSYLDVTGPGCLGVAVGMWIRSVFEVEISVLPIPSFGCKFQPTIDGIICQFLMSLVIQSDQGREFEKIVL